MTHLSRLAKIVLDVPTDLATEEQQFWASALGSPMASVEGAPEYVGLHLQQPNLLFFVQTLQEAPGSKTRFHLDFHTDNVEAEVARLTAAGARELTRIHSWVIMRDPAGLPFCIIPSMPGALNEKNSMRWP